MESFHSILNNENAIEKCEKNNMGNNAIVLLLKKSVKRNFIISWCCSLQLNVQFNEIAAKNVFIIIITIIYLFIQLLKF